MSNWMEQRLNELSRAERLREAEDWRLAAEAHGQSEKAPAARLYGPALARLGSWLMRLGVRMQARYGDLKLSATHGVLLNIYEETRSHYASQGRQR